MVGGNYPGGGGNYLGGIIIQWETVRGAIFLWGSCPGTIINDHYRFLWKYNARTIFVIKKPILLLRLKIELLFPSTAMKLVIWEWIFPEHFAAVSNLKSCFSLDGLSFLPKFFVDCMDSREFHYYKTIVLDPSYCFTDNSLNPNNRKFACAKFIVCNMKQFAMVWVFLFLLPYPVSGWIGVRFLQMSY